MGKGAFLNDKQIHVNDVESLDYCFAVMIAATQGVYPKKYQQAITRFLQTANNGWLHSFGTMLATGYLASGGIDFYVHNAGKDHDYLAPAIICAEAGALVTTHDGKSWTRDRTDIVIANPKLHPKVLALFQ